MKRACLLGLMAVTVLGSVACTDKRRTDAEAIVREWKKKKI
jgi:hypothetical protein